VATPLESNVDKIRRALVRLRCVCTMCLCGSLGVGTRVRGTHSVFNWPGTLDWDRRQDIASRYSSRFPIGGPSKGCVVIPVGHFAFAAMRTVFSAERGHDGGQAEPGPGRPWSMVWVSAST
jgi:hypothetical protein